MCFILAGNKFYAVRIGRNIGVYNTWEECKREVVNYKNAVYKSFSNYHDAELFVLGKSPGDEKNLSDRVVAYVDGSYNVSTGEYSCGVVAFYNGEKVLFSKKFNDRELARMRNVAGEIEGACAIMNYCIKNKIPALDIHYDYIGVENWALGTWKANKVGTIRYKKFYDSIKDKLQVMFIKVKAHSNDKYNDEADRLAKEALGIDTSKR